MILRATEHWCLHFTLVISATLAVGCSDVETDASRPQLQHEQHGAREQARRAAELLRKLRSQDPRERSVALASLVNPDGGGGYIPEEAIPDLVALLKSNSPGERAWAAGGLGYLEKHLAPRAIAPLIRALEDKDAKVRFRSAQALGRLKPEEAVPNLSKLTRDADMAVRHIAATALLRIGTPTAREAFAGYASKEVAQLLEFRKSPDRGVRAEATSYLETIIAGADATRPDDSVPLLIAILRSFGAAKEHLDFAEDPLRLNLAALRALQRLDSTEARTGIAAFSDDNVAQFTEDLESGDRSKMGNAWLWLKALGTPEAEEALKAMDRKIKEQSFLSH